MRQVLGAARAFAHFRDTEWLETRRAAAFRAYGRSSLVADDERVRALPHASTNRVERLAAA